MWFVKGNETVWLRLGQEWRGRRPLWVPKPRHWPMSSQRTGFSEAFRALPEVGSYREIARIPKGAAGHGTLGGGKGVAPPESWHGSDSRAGDWILDSL